jgi:hypothetical protein
MDDNKMSELNKLYKKGVECQDLKIWKLKLNLCQEVKAVFKKSKPHSYVEKRKQK